jgi:hypothetical protein
LYKNDGFIKFSEEELDYWGKIYLGVTKDRSAERKIFKRNLDELIQQNIKESGVDPRIAGPPIHIKNQVVAKLENMLKKIVKEKIDPNFLR